MDARSPDVPRRAFIASIAGGLLARPLAVGAQPAPKVPRVGLLLLFGTPGQPNSLVDAFRGGLRDLGYVEGETVLIDYRWAEGQEHRLADDAADLARLKVAVIVTPGTPATMAARAARISSHCKGRPMF